MESEKSGLYWLCKEADNRSSAVDSPVPELQVVPLAAAPDPAAVEKRQRGRPAKGAAKVVAAVQLKRKKKEDEDVCFICFDGGSLVLCDRGDCPKAYHPACIKRDEAFFRSKAKWNCGWHICSKCQKSSARYMCYTCTYSLCKGCTKDVDYLCVRENRGFCSTCFRVIKMIENIDQENKETVQVDFDDKLSWEYLFKVYWICLKTDLSLTVYEINRAQKLWTTPHKVTRREKSSAVYYLGNNGTMTRENPTIPSTYTSVQSFCDNNTTSVVSATWASKELLDFVAYMRNGDTSALSQKEVQALLLDYIKRNNLRDPHQRSEIICDLRLENLFGKPRVRHFEMLSLLEFHFHTKDDSHKDEIQGGIIDPFIGQVASESNSDNLPMISEIYRHKVDKTDKERVDGHEVKDACEKLENHVDSSGSTNNGHNNQVCLKSESLSGVKSETPVASLSTGSTPTANDREVESSWHYRDPNGKVQGPFGIEQLHKWSSTGIFPPDIRIWRLNTEERDSILLADVIKDQVQLQKSLSSSPWEVKGTSVSTSHHCDGPESGSANSAWIDTDAHSNDNLQMVKENDSIPHSSNWKTPVIDNNLQINNDAPIKSSSKCRDPEAPKVVHTYLNHPHEKTDAQIKHFSKCWNPERLKAVDSYLNQPEVDNDANIKSSSKCWDPEPPKVVDSYLKQPQVTNDAQIKSSSKCRDLEPPKVVVSYLNEPQVNIDAHIKISSKCFDLEPLKVDENQPQVNNDVKSKSSSKCWDLEPPKVVNLYLNHRQVHSMERSYPFKEKPHETILHQDRSKVGQMRNPTTNYEIWSSQGNMVPQTTGKECHKNQINEQRYLGHPSSEVPVQQNSLANNWNSHEAHPQYNAMANLTDSSEQKFTINLQDFPVPIMPKSSIAVLQAQNIKEQQRLPPPEVSVQNLSIQNVPSLTPKSSDHDEKDYFQNQKMSSLTDNFEKVRATDNKHSLSPNFPAEDCSPSWSSASSLVLGDGTHLPKKATKPFMEEWDSSFLSVCSLRPHDVANNHVATPTSKGDELPPPSPPNPIPNPSSWLAMMTEPFEFNTLAEESVSDLLAEVDAMESNSDLESPNLLMDYADDLFHDSKTESFTSLLALSSPHDQLRNDALCSSIDIMLPLQYNMRDEKIRAPSNDVVDPLKKSKRHSSINSATEVDTIRFEIPNDQFESRSNKHNLSPPKKIIDLADIMNAPTKHGNFNSTGSTRRESGQTPRGSGRKNRSTPDGVSGREHLKHGGERLTSPRDRNVMSAFTSPRDRNGSGGDSGFSKGIPSWSRQSSFGGGGSGSHSRSLPRGQRVCKFYGSGYC